MITPAYVGTLARYNRWQNRSIYGAADTLTDAQRKEPRGAFFGSIHATLNHLLYGDQAWIFRFTGTHKPKASTLAESVSMCPDWDELKRARRAFDEVIISWADRVDPEWLEGDLVWYSGALKRELTRPNALLVAHMFNHQTHHRGQVHCLLTQFGAKPDDTDLPFMPISEGE
jgi:uncharacterized damage-inducible protein DinB